MKHREYCQCQTCRTTNPHNHPQGAKGYWGAVETIRRIIEGKTIPRGIFYSLCNEHTIDPGLALENEAVVNALVAGDEAALRLALENEF